MKKLIIGTLLLLTGLGISGYFLLIIKPENETKTRLSDCQKLEQPLIESEKLIGEFYDSLLKNKLNHTRANQIADEFEQKAFPKLKAVQLTEPNLKRWHSTMVDSMRYFPDRARTFSQLKQSVKEYFELKDSGWVEGAFERSITWTYCDSEGYKILKEAEKDPEAFKKKYLNKSQE